MRRRIQAAPIRATAVLLAFLLLDPGVQGAAGDALLKERDAPPTREGFSLEAEPRVVTMSPAGTAVLFVSAYFIDSFESTETRLWMRGLPAGMSARFAPEPLTHQGMAALHLSGDRRVTPGSYALTVGATAEGLTRSLVVRLIVSREPDFGLSVSPATQAVTAKGKVVFSISVHGVNDFTGPVTLSVSGLADGARGAFYPNPVAAGHQSMLVIEQSHAIDLGRDDFVVTGTAGELTRQQEATLLAGGGASSWHVRQIASIGAPINTVLVGPGRDDGVRRVYAGTVTTGRVFEVSRTSSGWSDPVDIGGSPNGQEIHNMGMGPGRNDGVTRIYACSTDGHLYEITFNGPNWSQEAIGTRNGDCYHALVGKGRNDGVSRVYAARGNGVWEYTRRKGSWNEIKVGQVSGVAHGIAIGKGRRGRKKRIYVASTQNGTYEATFSEGSWRIANMGDDGDIRNVSVGRGRGDRVPRVYAATSSGRIREFTKRRRRWRSRMIGADVGAIMIHAWVVDGRNSGKKRVYGADSDGNAWEFTWTGSRWRTKNMGSARRYLYGFHFGRPQGSRKTRLFGGSFDGNLYQFTWR